MPELPEVETIRIDLTYVLLGKGIRDVEVLTGRCISDQKVLLQQVLKGNRFEAIRRRGKLLIFDLAFGEYTLLIHLKMTGQLICQIPGGIIAGGHPSVDVSSLPNKYTHIRFTFADGTELFFNDLRTFGYLQLVTDAELEDKLRSYGEEPLGEAFTLEYFLSQFQRRTTSLKVFLLNQSIIAGIGNIYADEICYRAKLRPDRNVSSLTLSEKKRLFNAIQSILQQAVQKRGTTFSDFVDASGNKGGYLPFLKVYGREGERCNRCGDDFIEKIKHAGRGTHFCANCQS